MTEQTRIHSESFSKAEALHFLSEKCMIARRRSRSYVDEWPAFCSQNGAFMARKGTWNEF